MSTASTSRLPRWGRSALGVACVILGAALTTRPFTSLSVLVLLAGATAIITGATRWGTARSTAGRLDDVLAVGWILAGILIIAWPDLTVRGIALVIGIAMIVGGIGDLVGGLRGTRDERLAAILKGIASVIFGVLALAWPDVTLLVVAIVFGIRTMIFGVSEVLAALRGDREPSDADKTRPGFLRRSFHLVVAATAVVLALALGSLSATLHKAEPVVSSFYNTPSEAPSEPGQLIRSELTDQSVPEGAKGWKILYTTTTADGQPAVASGLVIVPEGATGPLPVIGWAHGTTGVDRTCAPSLLSAGLASGAFFLTEDVMERGWALVATDYVGLGGEGEHPYLVGEPEARSVLDAVRAARQLKDIELTDQTVIWGHSQGGGAALWSGQIAPDYAPDANVIGIAALAPASDVAGLMSNLATMQGGSLFASYALVGYSSFYDDVKFDDYVVPTAATSVRETAKRCLSAEILPSVLTSVTLGMSVFSKDLTTGPLADRLAENVPTGPYEMPLLIGQGEADTLVVPTVQTRFVDGLCSSGNEVDYRTYAGRDHVPLVEPDSPAVPDLLEWTQQRFDGQAFTGNCSE